MIHSLRALRHRDFQLFFAGQGVSQIGIWLQLIATSWLIYRLSGSTFLLGLSAFALQIPFLVLAPVAGVWVDRLDRRRVIATTNSIALAQSLVMLALVASGWVAPWHLIAGNLVRGVVAACEAPARQTLLVTLVRGKADLPNAIALNSIMMNGARFVGPLVGGMVIAAFGEVAGFALNSLTYLAVLAALYAMRLAPSHRAPRDESWLRQFAAGLRYAYGFLPSRSALLLLSAVGFFAQPYQSLMPFFAKEVFHGDSRTLGMLIGAGGLGAVVGMIHLAMRPSIRGLLSLLAWTSAIAGASLAAFSFSTSLWLALPLITLTGLGIMLTAAATNTVLQSIVPDELRGRVASLYVVSFLGISPLGSLAAGWIAERIGAQATLAAGGICALAAALAYAITLPSIRREIRPVYQDLGIVPRPPADGDQ
jgi:MFS family permease